MDNKKISEMPTKTPGTLQEAIVAGKYWIPALMPNDPDTKNGRVDLGEMLLRLYNAINTAVSTEIQRRIDNGEIGLGGGGGSSSGQSQDTTTLSNRIQAVSDRVTALEAAGSWPTHYIKLIAPGQTPVTYALSTGMGVSPYTYGNPIEINTTNVSLPNFYATIRPGEPTVAANGQVTTRVTITISDKQGTIQLLGGTIGSVVVTGSISTSAGTYEFTASTIDKSGVTLGENNHIESFDVDLVSSANLPEGTTVSLVNVTCSISGKALGQSGSYLVQNGVATTGSGQIKLDSNGS